MKKRTLFLLMILTFLMFFSSINQAGFIKVDNHYSQSTYDFSAIDALLTQHAKDFNGIALIISKDGEIIYDNGFEGLDTDSVIPIASASKWLSGGCLLSVIDDTTLSLDTTVSVYLDKYHGKKEEITIRQLFSHTSGIPPSRGSGNKVFDKTITLEESVNIISDIDLIADPGTELWYGGFSMQVAGRIAEIAWLNQHNMNMTSGEAWMHIFNERIAKPLNMNHTDYHGLGETTNPRIAGGIQTSAKQYLNFLNMLLNNGRFKGKQILSEESVSQMLVDQTRNATIMQSPWQEYDTLKPESSETRYGIGCWLEEMNTTTGQGLEISSHGAFGFGPWIDIEQNISGVFSVYHINQKTISTYFDVKRILNQILLENNHPPTPPVIDGPLTGRVNKKQDFTLSLFDPDGDDLWYCIDWGDQTPLEWVGPYQNNTTLEISHKWKNTTDYLIKAKVKDSSSLESDWTHLKITISKNKMYQNPFFQRIKSTYQHILDSLSNKQVILYPKPPGQPADGPGGSTYDHASFTKNEYVSDAGRFFIFEPDAPRPSSAPVVVFYHRWFDADVTNYEPIIRHLTGNGLIVIWSDYNQDQTDLEEGVVNGLHIVRYALRELQNPGHITPDLCLFGAIGHSFGASITAAIGAQWQQYDIPSPSYLVLWCPGERGSEFIGDLSQCPSDCYTIQMVAEDDKSKHLATAKRIYDNTSHITNNEIYVVQTDRYGHPDLIADHYSAGSRQGHPNTLHFYGYWKIATAVALYKNNGIYEDYLNGNPNGLSMGQWSDGRDVNKMLFGIENVPSCLRNKYTLKLQHSFPIGNLYMNCLGDH
jgi:CubicO group peptidase (beta-lactamase class C family)